MAYAKKWKKITKLPKESFLFYLYFILFPLGQILRVEIDILKVHLTIQPLDLIVLLCIPYVLFIAKTAHQVRKYFLFFLYICVFSLLIAFSLYSPNEIFKGMLYLVRFIGYYFFFEYVWNLIQVHSLSQRHVLKTITISLVVLASTGWIQYIFVPDLRFLKVFNWDDHLYRLAGSLLDPGFTAILMVFGFFVSLHLYLKDKSKVYLILVFFFLITCLFTYARAAFIALAFGSVILGYLYKRNVIIPLVFIGFLSGALFFLPRFAGEGVKLERTNSILEKFKNYSETVSIIGDHPLFGIGFNTLCAEHIKRFPKSNEESHACPGVDSSILFVFATTGVLGCMAFVKWITKLWESVNHKKYAQLLLACSMALFVHSMFLNSFFYPWILGIMATLVSISM